MKRLILLIATVIVIASALLPGVWAETGRVVDADDKPVANAKVWIFRHEDRAQQPPILYTDKEGKFEYSLEGKKGMHYFLAAANRMTYAFDRKDAGDKREIKIALYPERRLEGRVVDENGRPIKGATIYIRRCSGYIQGREQLYFWFSEQTPWAGTFTSDKDGKFTVLHLPATEPFEYYDYSLVFNAPGRARLERKATNYRPLSSATFVLSPECTLSGTLYLPGKTAPVPECTEMIVTIYVPGEGQQYQEARTDKNGRFEFTQLPPGKSELMVQGLDPKWDGSKSIPPKPRDWVMPAVTDIELAPGKSVDLELTATKGSLITGKLVVKEANKPVTSAGIYVSHAGRPGFVSPERVYSDENGEFAVRVAPGEMEISVQTCRIDDEWLPLHDGDPPTVTLNAVDGVDKADVVVEIDPGSVARYRSGDFSVPDDLEILPGTYELAWDPEAVCGTRNYEVLRLHGDVAKAKMRKLPKLISQKPIYCAYAIENDDENNLLYMVLDESHGTGMGYDMAYVDANRNGDLTDDSPIRWKTSAYQMIKWIPIKATVGGVERPMSIRWNTGENAAPMSIQRKGGWRGTLDTNKGKIDVVTVDYNFNGKYSDMRRFEQINDLTADSEWGDFIFADINGFGRAVADSEYSDQALPLAPAVRVASKYYSIRVSDSGNSVTVEPYSGPVGMLVIDACDVNGFKGKAESLNLTGECGSYVLRNLDPSPIALPAGRYRLSWVSIAVDTGDKEPVTLAGMMSRWVDVEAGSETVVPISGKLTVAIAPDSDELVLRPGAREKIDWQFNLGDCLAGCYINSNRDYCPQAQFDGRGETTEVKAEGGG